MSADRVRERAGRWSTSSALGMGMIVPFYVQLDEGETRFDGAIARQHLTERLAMRLGRPETAPEVARWFELWRREREACVRVHPQGPVFVLPPGGGSAQG